MTAGRTVCEPSGQRNRFGLSFQAQPVFHAIANIALPNKGFLHGGSGIGRDVYRRFLLSGEKG